MNIFEAIGYVLGIVMSILIFIVIPILISVFITNCIGLTGIYWWVLVVIIALMVYTILAMLMPYDAEMEEDNEYFTVFMDSEGNLRDSEGKILDEDSQRLIWEFMKYIEENEGDDKE